MAKRISIIADAKKKILFAIKLLLEYDERKETIC